MKSYGNIVSQRENDSSLEIKLKVIDSCDIADREFKIAVMKKLNELQETHKDSSMSSGIKLMDKLILYQKTEVLKKYQNKILELKNSINEGIH